MVYGFLILNVGTLESFGKLNSFNSDGSMISSSSSPSLVLFSNFYHPQANNALKERRQQVIATRIQDEIRFRRSCKEGIRGVQNKESNMEILVEDGVLTFGQKEEDEEQIPLFSSPKIALWKVILRLLFFQQ